MEEKEVKIIYRPPAFNERYRNSLYEVKCEGLNSGYGYTLQKAIEDFDIVNCQ